MKFIKEHEASVIISLLMLLLVLFGISGHYNLNGYTAAILTYIALKTK